MNTTKTIETRQVTNLGVIAVIFALCASLLMPSFASAQTGNGTGTLTANGNGLAWFSGSGTATVSGTGGLRIRDYGHNTQVTVQATKGAKRVLANGWTRYIGFQGTITVTGPSYYVELGGTNINMTVSGTGKYVLRGIGTFSTSTTTGTWMAVTKTL